MNNPPTRRMQAHPNLTQLRRQAKELLRAFQAGDAAAIREVDAYYQCAPGEAFALHHAQLLIARAYGFGSWPKLKAYVDGVTMQRLVEAVRTGDPASVQRMLTVRPELANMALSYSDDPDERVSSGEGDWAAYSQGYPLWHAAARGQIDMAALLLDRGANPNVHVDSSGSAVYSAYSHRRWEMVKLLRARGGIVTADISAIYRETQLAREMLADEGGAEELLHRGAGAGAVEIVKLALEKIDWRRNDERWFTRCRRRYRSGITFRGCTRGTKNSIAKVTWRVSGLF